MAQAVSSLASGKKVRDLDVAGSDARARAWTGAIVAVMLIAVTASVAAANWADGVGLTPYAAIAGLLFGALVARLRLPGWLAHPLMLVEGAFVTAFLMSSIVTPSFATWNEKMLIMEMRVGRWAGAVTGGGIGTDALLFAMLLTALAWLVGYLAGWSVFRKGDPWGAILPAGVALLLNQFYAPPQSGAVLMIYLLGAMLLLVRLTLVKRQEGWRRNSIRFANDIGFDFITYGIVFSGIVILASWIVPPTAPGPEWFSGVTDSVRGPWQDLSEGVARAFSTVRQANTGGPTTMFGTSLSMGGPIHLGDRPVLDITATQGRYWRAVVFDRYEGTGWLSSSSQSDSFGPNDQRMKVPPVSLSREVTQTVKILLPGDNLVVSSTDPTRVSARVDARFTIIHGADNFAYQDISQLRLERRAQVGDLYNVVSVVSGADVDALRSAPADYPPDIRQRYLQLPSSVPARVHDLAQVITAGKLNPYDRAVAIQEYLRQKIKYDENVSAPPTDRDGVDYTLFDRPAGYCNYYASAMAVLAREIGIPARLASGYSAGDSENGVFHINEGQAHTWPELYFGSLGWIAFEPTANKPEIARPVKQVNSIPTPAPAETEQFPPKNPKNPDRDLENPERTTPLGRSTSIWPTGLAGIIASGLTGGLLIGIVALGYVQWSWNRKLRPLSAAARAWEEMYRLARLVGYDDRVFATPSERSALLAGALPGAEHVIADVTDLYVRERYGAYQLTPDEATRTGAETKELHRRILSGAVERAWRLGPVRLADAIRSGIESRIPKRETTETH